MKIDEHHCLQLHTLAEESCLINSEILQLLIEEGNDFWFELSGGSYPGYQRFSRAQWTEILCFVGLHIQT